MLALDPARVRMDRAVPGDTRPLGQTWPQLRTAGVARGQRDRHPGRPHRRHRRGRARALLDALAADLGSRDVTAVAVPVRAPDDRRVALVTGAGRGIGAATVLALADGGWAVLATDSAADDPALPYPMATAGRPGRGGRRRPARRPARRARCGRSPPTCATRPRWPAAVAEAEAPLGRPGRGRRRGRRDRRRGAAVAGAGGAAAGRPGRQPGRGAHPGPGRRARAAAPPEPRGPAGSWPWPRPRPPAGCPCWPPTARPRPAWPG